MKQEVIAKDMALFFNLIWRKTDTNIYSLIIRVTFYIKMLMLRIGDWRFLVVINLNLSDIINKRLPNRVLSKHLRFV